MGVLLGAPGPPEDSDVVIRFSLTNVMRASDLSEYTGELRSEMTVRLTDREAGIARLDLAGLPVRLHGPLQPHARIGAEASSCVPHERQRAHPRRDHRHQPRGLGARQAARLRRRPDEDADTEGDNSLFVTQGVFVP